MKDMKKKTTNELLKRYFEIEERKNKLLIQMRSIKKELKNRNIKD